jgi:triacylglycerol esterase/lipase EstA (alpha/beta hydrolase family)
MVYRPTPYTLGIQLVLDHLEIMESRQSIIQFIQFLGDYRKHKLIAAAQVDIVAHSTGGLMARVFAQQQHYKDLSNYLEGCINRLVTIGTPHFGACTDYQKRYWLFIAEYERVSSR